MECHELFCFCSELFFLDRHVKMYLKGSEDAVTIIVFSLLGKSVLFSFVKNESEINSLILELFIA